jgi:hypothetical protein
VGVLGVPVQLARATIESSANAQTILRTPRPENLHIPNTARPTIPSIAIPDGIEGILGREFGVAANTPLLVAKVSTVEAEPFAGGVSGFAVKAQDESPGNELQLSVTGELNPSIELTVTVVVIVPCVPTVAEEGEAEIVKSGPEATPVPDSATV